MGVCTTEFEKVNLISWNHPDETDPNNNSNVISEYLENNTQRGTAVSIDGICPKTMLGAMGEESYILLIETILSKGGIVVGGDFLSNRGKEISAKSDAERTGGVGGLLLASDLLLWGGLNKISRRKFMINGVIATGVVAGMAYGLLNFISPEESKIAEEVGCGGDGGLGEMMFNPESNDLAIRTALVSLKSAQLLPGMFRYGIWGFSHLVKPAIQKSREIAQDMRMYSEAYFVAEAIWMIKNGFDSEKVIKELSGLMYNAGTLKAILLTKEEYPEVRTVGYSGRILGFDTRGVNEFNIQTKLIDRSQTIINMANKYLNQ